MIYRPDTNACTTLLRGQSPHLEARWRDVKASDVATCSVVVYELRYGAERSSNPSSEHAKLDTFFEPFICLPFDDVCVRRCARIRRQLEASSQSIGPHDLQIAAIALHHDLVLVTHNTREFRRVGGLKTEDWEARTS